MVASKAFAKPEIGIRGRQQGVMSEGRVHRLFYNTESAGLQAECAIGSSWAGYAAKSA
jgi:hypothetical protein